MVRRTRGSGRGGPARQTDRPHQGHPGLPWENAPASSPEAPGPPPAGPGTRQVDGPATASYASIASCYVHCVLLRLWVYCVSCVSMHLADAIDATDATDAMDVSVLPVPRRPS